MIDLFADGVLVLTWDFFVDKDIDKSQVELPEEQIAVNKRFGDRIGIAENFDKVNTGVICDIDFDSIDGETYEGLVQQQINTALPSLKANDSIEIQNIIVTTEATKEMSTLDGNLIGMIRESMD